MRFRIAALTITLALFPALSGAEWRIVEDDFLYIRQDTPEGSVMLYCSKPGHRLYPVIFVWPKTLFTGNVPSGVIKLIIPGAEEAKALWATKYANVATLTLDQDTDDLVGRLREVAEQGGSVSVITQDKDSKKMSIHIDLQGYLEKMDRFHKMCMEFSENWLGRLGRRRASP